MLVAIPQALNPEQLQAVRARLDAAGDAWIDGRVSAGYQGVPVKFNQQIDERADVAAQCQSLVLGALERHPLFISAALPNEVYPPMFNRYGEGMSFGAHVDGSVRIHPHTGRKLRTDVSATLFLTDPADYDGGELVVLDTFGEHRVKLPAGDLILYSATSRHHVTQVTRGSRWSSFFWVQSMVRDESARSMLFDLDTAIQGLRNQIGDNTEVVALTGLYHNLLRRWAES